MGLKKKSPPENGGRFFFVETRGTDVPNKDEACRGPIWIFRL